MADREQYAVKTRTHWENDADVLQCQGAEECPLGDGSAGVTFTMAIRKHHCRFCGWSGAGPEPTRQRGPMPPDGASAGVRLLSLLGRAA